MRCISTTSLATRLRLHNPGKPGSRGHVRMSASHSGQAAPKYTNRLAQEKSPYLLQHAHNPVDWYPWGEAAFKAAKEQDKPIFLSIGYATCHWCHVMEHESFESEETAAILNKDFISIKVDREERPDVDRVYMTFVQALSGHGGWPMSVWLTPDLEPFTGGTYFPAKDQYGMPSFNTILRRVANLWSTKRDELQEQGSRFLEALRGEVAPEGAASGSAAGALTPPQLAAAVQACAKQLMQGYDKVLGGFGGPPKFPRPAEINLMLRAAQLTKASDPSASNAWREAALFTLSRMAAGGMYDHLGGGFHRYSVDELWHVPHFEKMLYDNPQLVLTYLDAYRLVGSHLFNIQHSSGATGQTGQTDQPSTASTSAGQQGGLTDLLSRTQAYTPGSTTATGSSSSSSKAGQGLTGHGQDVVDDLQQRQQQFGLVVRGILDYLRRDMTHPDGGLFSAEDADSLDAGSGKKLEGAFYVWTRQQLEEVLGQDASALFCSVYGVKQEGNCTMSHSSDPHKEFEGKNVLYQAQTVAEAASASGKSEAEVLEALGKARQKLHAARAQRPRPSLDNKVVTAWNGQGISAFALSARTLSGQQLHPGCLFPVDGCPAATYLGAALRVGQFVKEHLWDAANSRLRRNYCNGVGVVDGFADDYAHMVAGCIDLYEAGGGRQWLTWAVQLQQVMDELFWDSQAGGYYSTTGDDPSIKLRMKEDYDGAEPSASSIAAANLMRLAALLPKAPAHTTSSSSSSAAAGRAPAGPADAAGDSAASSSSGTIAEEYLSKADTVFVAMRERLEKAPVAIPQVAASAWLKGRWPLRQVIIAGSPCKPEHEALLDAAHQAWAPDKILVLIDPSDAASKAFWQQHNPEAWDMVHAQVQKVAGGKAEQLPATAFVCQNYTCQAPTSDPVKLMQQLLQ